MGQLFLVGLALQVIGWGFQVVIGHQIFEGRAPALTESAFQVLVSPMFLALEALFLLGYNHSLCHTIDVRAAQLIAEWKVSQKQSAATTTARSKLN